MGSTEASVPSHYKALVYDNPGTISTRIDTLEVPKPGVGEVLVNLTHSGICHSDLAIMLNLVSLLPMPILPGQIGGHEGVGTVVAFGSGAETSGLKIGNRVGIKAVATICGNCLPCLSGYDASCPNGKYSGYYTPGTFQQYALAPANYVTPIPDGLASELAAPLLCAGVTVYAALKKSGAQAGDFVTVSGAGGGLGHLALQIGSRGMGFRMIALDTGDKEQLCRDCGAEVFFDITKYSKDEQGNENLAAAVKKATSGGLGVAAVIVCTSANAAYSQAVSFLRFHGTVVCVGVPEGNPVPINGFVPSAIIQQEFRIIGSCVGNRRDALETMELAARGVIKTRLATVPMSALTETFEKMHKGQLQGRVVIDLSKE